MKRSRNRSLAEDGGGRRRLKPSGDGPAECGAVPPGCPLSSGGCLRMLERSRGWPRPAGRRLRPSAAAPAVGRVDSIDPQPENPAMRRPTLPMATIAPAIVLLAIPAWSPAARAASPFPDKNLEAAIREVLKHEPKVELTDEKLQNVYFLEATGKDIKDLTGLEKCKNLAAAQARQEQDQRHQGAQGPDQPAIARPVRQRDQGHRPAGEPQGPPVHRALGQPGREARAARRPDRPDVVVPRARTRSRTSRRWRP